MTRSRSSPRLVGTAIVVTVVGEVDNVIPRPGFEPRSLRLRGLPVHALNPEWWSLT